MPYWAAQASLHSIVCRVNVTVTVGVYTVAPAVSVTTHRHTDVKLTFEFGIVRLHRVEFDVGFTTEVCVSPDTYCQAYV